jgi:hypothetical protein
LQKAGQGLDGSFVTYIRRRNENTMVDAAPPPVITQEVRIVDANGHARILLSAKDGIPTIVLLRDDGTAALTARTDQAGRPAVTLANPSPTGPSAALEIDDKGAHVKFDRPGGASAYLFLNNAGASGVVLIDAKGRRRLDTMIGADGAPTIQKLGEDGGPLP